MRGSRNFHERGSNENGNFWSQMRGGLTPPKILKLPFLGKFSNSRGVRTPGPSSGSAHETQCLWSFNSTCICVILIELQYNTDCKIGIVSAVDTGLQKMTKKKSKKKSRMKLRNFMSFETDISNFIFNSNMIV